MALRPIPPAAPEAVVFRAPPASTDRRVVALAATAFAPGALWIGGAVTLRQLALFLTGGALGLVLYHALFGFTSVWRVFISDRRGAGLRAQMVMLALACALFLPALASGALFGEPVSGFVAPVGVSVVGAFPSGSEPAPDVRAKG